MHLYQVGMAVALLSITAFFIAMMVAFGARISHSQPVPVRIPGVLWVSTSVLLASGISLELARYSLRRARVLAYRQRMWVTSALGALFLALQVDSWFELSRQGVLIQRNPQGSMFYVFTGIHGAHVVVGLILLLWLLHRARSLQPDNEQGLRRHRISLTVAAWYWHFMDILWLVLFALLHLWT
jgi:cytochrome c oxidase subunit 3